MTSIQSLNTQIDYYQDHYNLTHPCDQAICDDEESVNTDSSSITQFVSSRMDVDEKISFDDIDSILFSPVFDASNLSLKESHTIKRLEQDDASVVPVLQKNNIDLYTRLPNQETLGFNLSRQQSFRILSSMLNEGLLNLNMPVDGVPFWFHYLKSRSLLTGKPPSSNRKDANILKLFLRKIADHLENEPQFNTLAENNFLLPFCLEQNRYQTLSRLILQTGLGESALDEEAITLTLLYGLLDKRGKLDKFSDYNEGSFPSDNVYMIMKALQGVFYKFENLAAKPKFQNICTLLSNSLSFNFSITSIEKASEKSKIVLSALKTFNFSYPLLFDVRSANHSIPFGIDYKEGQFYVTVYNTGLGVKKHHPLNGGKGPQTFYSTSCKIITDKKILWTRLFRQPRTVDEVYTNIEAILRDRKASQMDDSIYFDSLQQRSSCAFQGLMSFIQHQFLENFPGSLEERKGAYKFFKAKLLTTLSEVYGPYANPAFAELLTKKNCIHEGEIALLDLAENNTLTNGLLNYFFHEPLLKNEFTKIEQRYLALREHSSFSNFYFLLRVLRQIAKTKDSTFWSVISKKLRNQTIDNLMNALNDLQPTKVVK